LTLGEDDTVSDETVDSVQMIEQEVKDTAGVAIAQPALDSPDIVVVSSAENPTAVEGLSTLNPAALNTPPS